MKEHSIDIDGLNITYKSVQAYSIRHNLLSLKKKKVSAPHTSRRKKSSAKLVHAVKGVSFFVEKGEVLGIIGRNGSGKSTLLKAMAGIFSPDSGSIDLHGNTISLLAIGAGFKNEATGRENIMLNGLLLGFSEKQIKEKINEIIEFSELGDFINFPVKTYSSGMRSKLAFSIAANLDTDILLVDEILSVGDLHFRKKSYQKMRELIRNENRTAIIVSHQENTLKTLCDRVLWMDSGTIKMLGKPKEVIDAYTAFMN